MSPRRTTRLGVLCMDELPGPVRPVGGDYPELYGDLVRAAPVEVVVYAGHRGELPDDVGECDAWLVGGSRRSVYEDVPWIRDGEEFVRRAIAAERPLVGICFGHQLVASALGGTVELAGWQLGAQRYEVADPVPWFPDDRLTLVASHRDQVTRLPPGATAWLVSDRCPVAGMTVGDRVWTVQGHPEFTAAVADELLTVRADVVGPAAADAARSTLDRPLSNAAFGRALARFIAGTR